MDLSEKLYRIELKGEMSNTEFVMELIAANGFEFSAHTEVDEGYTIYTSYDENESVLIAMVDQLRMCYKIWNEFGVVLSDPVISSIKKEDWTEVWKRYFKIQHISDRLVIKATWLDYEVKENDIVIEIDPGMSFGTGSHETTQYCLKMIEELSDKNLKSFVDVGCGSGILSIAAAKMGFSPVCGFDFDQESVDAALENLKRNGVEGDSVTISQAKLEDYKIEQKFDVVNANIISSVLVANSEKLVSFVSGGGYLILAGILQRDYDQIKQEFLKLGVIELGSYTEKDWTGGLFFRQ